ncbi:ATP binding protein [Methanocaldococcus villosus KIN24-T80]|uniref:ATP binding protein n=1 Tax=Methanocaldococcus villosus KIN24-T80 TaxID=1069083 RepID=N6VUD6_9EURY|nr:TIGR00289 family protein [Methanocaldococcus villosus]ENN96811.1 ATP binding protein [Methanocaldococcus villosus KIN24-T80]
MDVAVLYSGGKDSNYALYWAIKMGHNVKYLVNVESENKESYMFHIPNVHLTNLSSKASGIPLIKIYTKGEKEKEVEDLKEGLKELDIDAVVTGAVASVYQKSRIDKICEELKIKSLAPLWGKDPEWILRETSKLFEVIIVGVYAYGLGKEWLGKVINEDNIDKLIDICNKYGIHKAFEGGEAETFVLDSPVFKKRIVIEEAEIEWHETWGVYHIKKAKLVKKE